ncbi:LysR family transcriptional regulator [uncultured Ferrimonas sp.]|uniref:LysR family transcriptional regulator n=1 Tax=uncultured Ferrimonas sp. TaxID=432640 RepID=UPI0026079646|nr:LysR family transcriptional regulator [uncultured Ferrimonas sp.]
MNDNDLRVFHLIAESGSLVQAAQRLERPKSHLSRRLQQLEQQLGVALFYRHARRLSLTPNGSRFYQSTKPIVQQLQQAVEAITAVPDELEGQLRIQLLPMPASDPVQELIFEFAQLHPKVNIELRCSATHDDIVQHQVDVAFQINGPNPLDGRFVVRRLLSAQLSYFASADYLRLHGQPHTMAELAQHRLVRFRLPDGTVMRNGPLGELAPSLLQNSTLLVNTLELLTQAVLHGQGIGLLDESACQEMIESGRVVRLFADTPPFLGAYDLVYPSRNHLSVVAQAFVDFMLKQKALTPSVYG